MLNKIALRNFQKHQDLTLDLEDITTVVGESDAGKSSVIRALRWACFNDSQGNAFFHIGTDACAVKLRIDDDIIVTRSKGKENKYVLKDGSDAEEFKAVNRDVPPDIQAILNISQELNFQSQHDAPFWLTISAGALTKQLNGIVDLDFMDRVQAAAKAKLQEIERGIKNTKDEILKNQVTIQTLDFLPEAYKELEVIEALEEQHTKAQSDLNRLDTLYQQINDAIEAHADCSSKVTTLKSRMVDCKKIIDTQDQIDTIKEQVDQLKGFIKLHKDSSKPQPPLDLLDEWNTKNTELTTLQSLLDKIQRCESDVTIAKKQVTTTKAELDKVKHLTCPTCNRPMP
jgi:DNA repair exonuclease SbcCD ATPase subunit